MLYSVSNEAAHTKGTLMEVILEMPKDFADYLKSFGFDAFYHLLDRNVHVIIEPSNARELTRLGEVIADVD